MEYVKITNFSDWFEATDEELISLFSGVMICYPNPKLNYQPERSKREDHESGCGALNTMET